MKAGFVLNDVIKDWKYLVQELGTCVEIVPSEMFSSDHSIGLRDIGLKITHHIQQGRKVVVSDGNELRRVRESYIRLLRKKCKDCKVRVITVIPKFGCMQLLWTQEHRLAENAKKTSCQMRLVDAKILKWFDKETDININYKVGVVDAVKDSEDCVVETHVVGFLAQSIYKWELPALFVQWELVMECEGNGRRTVNITDVLSKWSKSHPYGRIILICDGNRIRTGEKSKQQEISDIKTSALHISQQLSSNAIYIYHIDEPNTAGSFVLPPKPGILAFLQGRHGLNLHSKSSLYLYETTDHMKMAEHAGVRHLKGTKVLKNPALVISQTAATVPPIPEMLKSFCLRPSDGTRQTPSIPLFDQKDSYHNGMISSSIGNGRTEYVFVESWMIFQRLQEIHVKSLTKLGETGSKINPESIVQSEGFIPITSEMDQSKISTMSRDLPKWMLGKEGSGKSSKSSLESVLASEYDDKDSATSRKTVYMMTDHELIEEAMDVLKQAGKTDIIDAFQSGHKSKVAREARAVAGRKNSLEKDIHSVSSIKKRKYNQSHSLLTPKLEQDSGDTCSNDNHQVKQCRTKIKDLSESQDAGVDNGISSNQTLKFMANQENLDSNDSMTRMDNGLDCLEDSMDSDVCPSTESSQDSRNSSVLDSESHDEIDNQEKGAIVKKEAVITHQVDKDKPSVVFKDDMLRQSRYSSPEKGPRRKHAPDLSILDEIFS